MSCIQRVNIYMFDEPSSYLDVKQRINASRAIRSLIKEDSYIVVVEHDLAVLDYLSDHICCLYGQPGVYGVVTAPFSVREGINVFLDGYLPTENVRFRKEALKFKARCEFTEEEVSRLCRFKYPRMTKNLGTFNLSVHAGEFTSSEIMVLLGENGTGKTSFIKMLAGKLEPDEGKSHLPQLTMSYKPQEISPKRQVTVRKLLREKIRDAYE